MPLQFSFLLLLPVLAAMAGFAQKEPSGPQSPHSPDITLHISTNLVLVDVVVQDAKNGLPDSTLKREDFQVFDDGHPVPIKTFDTGTGTRPLALWFVVQCKMPDWEAEGSGLFAGQISLLNPGLKKLDKQDTVAVAHWCDNGDSTLDLLPTSNIEQAGSTMEQVLASTPAGPFKHDRTGELALQKTLQLIVDATRSLPRDTVPIVIFLYGDFSAMPKPEADHFVNELLATSATVYGLRDRRSPRIMGFQWLGGEQGSIANYISAETGGQYLPVTPETYAKGLGDILEQLHSRYELGFEPRVLDGKPHKLSVRLAGSGKNTHKGVHLRYRTGYVPIRRQPE
jgi:hypothetical protein